MVTFYLGYKWRARVYNSSKFKPIFGQKMGLNFEETLSMSDIFYDLETKELLDLTLEDHSSAIRSLHFSVGVTQCECHKEQIFYRADAMGEHVLAHERMIGFSNRQFDNAVLAYNYFLARAETPPARQEKQSARTKIDKIEIPSSPDELKRLLDGRSFDVQIDLEARLGYRLALNALAQGTLRREKQGTAAWAVIWYRLAAQLKQKYAYALREANDHEGADRAHELGAYFQERLERYCATDVSLVRQVFEYGAQNRRVFYLDFDGERKNVKVDWR